MELIDYHKKKHREAFGKMTGWFDRVTFTLDKLPPLKATPGTLWYYNGRAFIKKRCIWDEIKIQKKQLEAFIDKVKGLAKDGSWKGRTFDISGKGMFYYHIEDDNIVIAQKGAQV